MLTYIQAGGWSMLIVIAFGLALLVTSTRFFFQARPERLAMIRALSVAMVFWILGGVAFNVTTVLWTVAAQPDPAGGLRVDWLIQGLGEAITPAGLGFPALGVTWLLVAVGVRRAHDLPG